MCHSMHKKLCQTYNIFKNLMNLERKTICADFRRSERDRSGTTAEMKCRR
jgi:hypothetical protein